MIIARSRRARLRQGQRASVALAPEGAGTRMRYDADAQVGGKVASVGQRLARGVGARDRQAEPEGLHENIKIRASAHAAQSPPRQAAARTAPPAGGAAEAPGDPAPVVALKQVDQSALAANVAKEVVRSLIPMPVLIGIVVAVAALIVWLVVRH
jgi:hypothetical protein